MLAPAHVFLSIHNPKWFFGSGGEIAAPGSASSAGRGGSGRLDAWLRVLRVNILARTKLTEAGLCVLCVSVRNAKCRSLDSLRSLGMTAGSLRSLGMTAVFLRRSG